MIIKNKLRVGFTLLALSSFSTNAADFTWQAGYGSLTSGLGASINYEFDNISTFSDALFKIPFKYSP